MLQSPLDLAGKTVHVTKGLHTCTLLEHLSEEIGDAIYVVECDTLNPIELMHLVNEGKIDYTVVDEYIARTVSYNLKNVDSKLPVSIEQPIGWVVRQHDNDSSLQIAINEWIANS